MATGTEQTHRRETISSGRSAAPRSLTYRLVTLALVALAYYVGARVGLSLSLVEQNITPLWPAIGVAVAAFLLLGRSQWPAVAVAALVVNIPISANLLAALVIAGGNTLAPFVAVTLLRRMGFRRQVDRQRDAVAIVFVGALSTLISSTIGAATLAASGSITPSRLLPAWAVWWTGDAMGVLAVTPFLLSLALLRERPHWPARRWLEAVAILAVVSAAAIWASQSGNLLFLALPPLGWAAWRLQLRGAGIGALIVSLAATWSASQATGPFAGHGLAGRMLTLQAFNCSVALTSFVLASLVSERLRAADELRELANDLELRVEQRTTELSAANARLLDEIRQRSEAQEHLSQEAARAAREHDLAQVLQSGLLPSKLPETPGVALAARYIPATADVQVGGDWYDVIQLPDGRIGLAIGDVAGHGLRAAATMVQLKAALRAYALQDPSPPAVMRGVHQLVAHLPVPEMVTLLYALFDPASRLLRFSSAGHPPALVCTSDGGTYLSGALAPPIGVTADGTFNESSHDLPPGGTLLLYTDGLVERRGVSIQVGLDRLQELSVAHSDDNPEQLCDRLHSELLEPDRIADDVALVVMRPLPRNVPFRVTLPAEARMLTQLRGALRRWLRESGVKSADEGDILIACGEACANVVQHAYRATPGTMEVSSRLVDGYLELSVCDHGGWREPADRGGGWGLQLIRGLMESVEVDRLEEGTRVVMRRPVSTVDAT